MSARKPNHCERCGAFIRKTKRFCKPCAVEVAKEFHLDYFEPDADEPSKGDDEDPIVVYERENKVKTAIALALLAIIGMIGVWALVAGW